MKNIELSMEKIKFLKNFFLIIFFYTVLEGGIRKWFFPNLRVEITLIRDFIIIYGIFYSFNNGIYNQSQYSKNTIFLWTLLIIFWIIVQLSIKQNYYKVYLVGFRHWVLYFWFSIMFVNAFSKETVDQISKIILLTIIPIGLLSITQHYLSSDHVLNTQSGFREEEYIFTVSKGIVRTTATFSFSSGNGGYMAFITPFFLYFIDGAYKKNFSKKIKFLLVFCYFFACLTSGSRFVILYCAWMFLGYLAYILINRKEKKITTYLFWICVLAITSLFFFQNSIDATFERFDSDKGSLLARSFESMFGSKEVWQDFSFFGMGIGGGSNLSREYLGGSIFAFGETEPDRILTEGGFVGLFLIICKFLFSIIVVFKSYKLSKISNNILPFFFSIYLFQQVMAGVTSGVTTAHAFTFLGLGFMFLLLTMNRYHEK